MKLKKNKNKLKQLRNRFLSSKALALFVLNRKVKFMIGQDKDFGTLTDLQLDRQAKNLTLEVERDRESSTITINNYGFETRKGTPYLIWKSVNFTGPDTPYFQDVFSRINGIELSKRYISVVEAIL